MHIHNVNCKCPKVMCGSFSDRLIINNVPCIDNVYKFGLVIRPLNYYIIHKYINIYIYNAN